MYNYISGKLVEVNATQAVIDCSGVGYLIEISLNTYAQIKDSANVKLLVHEVIREDAHLLYGFFESAERDMFRMLISVNGVGVATARVMLSSLTVSELMQAIASQNTRLIQSVKGIGTKTAQRIVLELKDKISETANSQLVDSLNATNVAQEEALSALVMLGFPKAASEKVLNAIVKIEPSLTVEELIKESLKRL